MPELSAEQQEMARKSQKALDGHLEQGRVLETQPHVPREQPFMPDSKSEEGARKVAEIIKPAVTSEEIHHEAGVPLETEYKTEKEKTEAIARLISSGGSGYDMNRALEHLLDKDQKAA